MFLNHVIKQAKKVNQAIIINQNRDNEVDCFDITQSLFFFFFKLIKQFLELTKKINEKKAVYFLVLTLNQPLNLTLAHLVVILTSYLLGKCTASTV